MKVASVLIILAVAGLIIGLIASAVSATYQYDRDFESHWKLADRASTIVAKSKHMDDFVAALEGAKLSGQHNAAIFKTPTNGFDENLAALKTLQGRLREVQGMDPRSFEYQTAMQQITAQEQGEAGGMLGVLEGCWWKQHHPLLWSWWGALTILGCFVLVLFAVWFAMLAYDVQV
jgi:hypothetical protein